MRLQVKLLPLVLPFCGIGLLLYLCRTVIGAPSGLGTPARGLVHATGSKFILLMVLLSVFGVLLYFLHGAIRKKWPARSFPESTAGRSDLVVWVAIGSVAGTLAAALGLLRPENWLPYLVILGLTVAVIAVIQFLTNPPRIIRRRLPESLFKETKEFYLLVVTKHAIAFAAFWAIVGALCGLVYGGMQEDKYRNGMYRVYYRIEGLSVHEAGRGGVHYMPEGYAKHSRSAPLGGS